MEEIETVLKHNVSIRLTKPCILRKELKCKRFNSKEFE